MIDGEKQLEDLVAALEPPLVHPLRAIVVVVLVVLLGGLVIAGS